MAEVPVTISSAVIIDYYGRVIVGPVQIRGLASRSDLGIGGGPMPPGPGGGGPGGGGPGGPVDPGWGYPERPVDPGYGIPGPPYPGGPGGDPPHPAHPIVLPPDQPPTEPPTQPPNVTWVWGWNRQLGWHPVYVPSEGTAGPKS